MKGLFLPEVSLQLIVSIYGGVYSDRNNLSSTPIKHVNFLNQSNANELIMPETEE
jgi:hypothetical protein